MITVAIIGAGGRGKDAYAQYMLKHQERFKVVAVAERNAEKREEIKKMCEIPDEMCFDDYADLFAKERLADCVMICTQDRDHFRPAMLAMDKGYHIFVEKPVSPDIEELRLFEEKAKDYPNLFMTGYVLRYTPFFKKIKQLVDNGEIGNIISIQLNENEGYWHHAHSYVRGPWKNSKTSSPLILAKSCHDMDLMLHLLGNGMGCRKISSYGSNTYFKRDNAPEGSAERCSECPLADECKYNAAYAYTKGDAKYFAHLLKSQKMSIDEYLKTSPYGQCVFKCDNDVVDHQVASMEFDNGITAVFTVCAFTEKNNRTMKVMGTEGEIGGCMEDGEIVLKKFGKPSESFTVTHDGTRHCGGDSGIVEEIARRIESKEISFDNAVIDSHIMALAAEESRLSGKTVEIKEFKQKYGFN